MIDEELCLRKKASKECIINDTFDITKTQSSSNISDWEIGEEIGEGSFSKSRTIRNKLTGEVNALKIYDKISLESQRKLKYSTMEWTNNLERVKDEIEIWTGLCNDHVSRVYEQFEKDGWHKLYIRNEIGDFGVPAEFDFDTREFVIKDSVYQLFKDRIIIEDKVYRSILEEDFFTKGNVKPKISEMTLDAPIGDIDSDLELDQDDQPPMEDLKLGQKQQSYGGQLQTCTSVIVENEIKEKKQKLHEKSDYDQDIVFHTELEKMDPMISRQYIVGRILFDVCVGLYYIHNLWIVHRDIKIQNVVVSSKSYGKAMLIDFNSAATFMPKQTFQDFEGTLHYAAPETQQGDDDDEDDEQNPPVFIDKDNQGYDGHLADLWSLGVCLYALYFGKLPYDCGDEVDGLGYELELSMKILKDPVNFDFAPEPLKALLEGQLQKDPTKRWSWDMIWDCQLFKTLHKKIIVID